MNFNALPYCRGNTSDYEKILDGKPFAKVYKRMIVC